MRSALSPAGNYDGASIYYEGLIPSLQRLITSISDPLRKGKWTMVSLGGASCAEAEWLHSFDRFSSRSARSTSS